MHCIIILQNKYLGTVYLFSKKFTHILRTALCFRNVFFFRKAIDVGFYNQSAIKKSFISWHGYLSFFRKVGMIVQKKQGVATHDQRRSKE